jgi:ABC-type nitrate/sulfonate/bicarbonate transport system substrate-binding protein
MKRIAFLVATAVGLVLAGIAQSRAEDLIRVGLAVPNNAEYTPFYAAETLGFYKEAGLKVELTVDKSAECRTHSGK